MSRDQSQLKEWNEIKKYSEESFDKLLVYLASGGLVLTVGFTKDIVDLSKAEVLWLLMLTWILFAISLVVNLVSHLTANKSVDHFINEQTDQGYKWSAMTSRLNIIALLTLAVGIITFVIFIINNI